MSNVYWVQLIWEQTGGVGVVANTPEEAAEKALDVPYPISLSIVEDSKRVDAVRDAGNMEALKVYHNPTTMTVLDEVLWAVKNLRTNAKRTEDLTAYNAYSKVVGEIYRIREQMQQP